MKKEELARLDREGIWHPFTQMADYQHEEPVIIERGEGATLIDINGKRYLDGVSSLWVNVHGHCHPKLDEALKNQTDKIAHSTLLGISNVPAIEFAEQLLRVTPANLQHVFYSDSGSTAVEIALKIAFQYQQQIGKKEKTKFISFSNAYHGDTIGAVGVGGIDLFHSIYHPLLFDSFRAPHPYPYRCSSCHPELSDCHPERSEGSPRVRSFVANVPQDDRPNDSMAEQCKRHCLNQFERLLQEHHGEIAACILEPLVQGAAGIVTAPTGFLKGVRILCDRYDVLLILDEVATGFGRTGTLFACEQEGVEPDILCLAKGITGGYLPLAATLTTHKIYEAFLGKYEELKTFFHGHTYTGNPLACAVAIANLKIFEEEKTMERVQLRIGQLRELLQRFEDLPVVGEVRQCGMMAGIELIEQNVSHPIVLKARERGLILRPLGPVIVLMPPLCVSEAELSDICTIAYEAIREVTQGVC